MKRMKLPTEKQCLNYFSEYKVPDNILRHCCKVREIAVWLAQQLQEKKIPINVEFASCLAYFHDLCKMIAIKDFGANEFHKDAVVTPEQAEFWRTMQQKYPNHYEGEMAYKLFRSKYPELALSLRQVSSPHNLDPSWEELVVHYADWRVLREKIVSLAERLAYLKKRYPRTDDSWQKYEQLIKAQEQKIFSTLSFEPDQLAEEVKKNLEKKPLTVKHGP